MTQRSKAATECREALGVRGACSRFGARRVVARRVVADQKLKC